MDKAFWRTIAYAIRPVLVTPSLNFVDVLAFNVKVNSADILIIEQMLTAASTADHPIDRSRTITASNDDRLATKLRSYLFQELS